MTPNGVLFQDASGKSYRIPAERLNEFEVQGASSAPGTVAVSLPTGDIIEELPMQPRAMLQTGS